MGLSGFPVFERTLCIFERTLCKVSVGIWGLRRGVVTTFLVQQAWTYTPALLLTVSFLVCEKDSRKTPLQVCDSRRQDDDASPRWL